MKRQKVKTLNLKQGVCVPYNLRGIGVAIERVMRMTSAVQSSDIFVTVSRCRPGCISADTGAESRPLPTCLSRSGGRRHVTACCRQGRPAGLAPMPCRYSSQQSCLPRIKQQESTCCALDLPMRLNALHCLNLVGYASPQLESSGRQLQTLVSAYA